ncbi:hypothetical protein ACFONN_16250 [Dyella humi]|uniref:Uncharacterized protein n=1 Tax=Dyella humi TaxID=1770547 RepID=A0ABW8IQM5_9GAMM
METYYALGKSIVVLGVAFQCALLFIQGWALSKSRERCFVLLFSGAALGLVYSMLAGLPFFIRLSLQSHVVLGKVTLGLLAIGAALGVWGMALLVRSYYNLSQNAPFGSSGKT